MPEPSSRVAATPGDQSAVASRRLNLPWLCPVSGKMARFDPEKMAVYRLARAHTRAVRALIARADTRGFGDLVRQLRESTASIPANVLEASGEWRIGKRIHYLNIAKGSAWESWGHTDSFVDFELVPEEAIAEIRDLQNQITALLITTIRNLEAEVKAKRARRGGRSSPCATPPAAPSPARPAWRAGRAPAATVATAMSRTAHRAPI